MRFGLTLLLLLMSIPARADCVILLHGLARTASSMETMEEALTAQGLKVINVDYPSTEFNVQALAPMAIEPALELCAARIPVHFVTHSLGGILVRQYLSQTSIPDLGRVVMLGPPNKGSEVVDKLGEMPGFYQLNGPAGMQLGTGPDSVPNSLGTADFDLGIIAGTSSINWMLSSLIPGDDDGKVSVQRARLNGMRGFITLPVTHTFMMKNDAVIQQVTHYLQTGTFE